MDFGSVVGLIGAAYTASLSDISLEKIFVDLNVAEAATRRAIKHKMTAPVPMVKRSFL